MTHREEPGLPDTLSASENDKSSRRNPIYIFMGFFLFGAALAILIFGRDLFSSRQSGGPVIVGGSTTTVLDQVSELPQLANDGTAKEEKSNGPVDVGDKAINFTLDDLDGNPVTLADFIGQPVIINFWATWCAPCRIEMPELQRAYEKYQDQRLVILALNQDEPAEVARAFFFDEMRLSFTPLLDQDSSVSSQYGSFGILPSTFFVDPDGIVSAIHRGPLTLGQIDNYLAVSIGNQDSEGAS